MSSLPLNLALFEAVTKSDIDRVNELLSQGASPQWQYDKYGDRTALHKSIENQNSTITELLIKHIVQQAVKSGDASVGNWLSQVLTSSAIPSEPVARSATRGSIHTEYSSLPLKERVERALAAVVRGEFVVVMDGEDRENEGDLIMAAEKVTPEQMAFMVNYTSGIICIGITGTRAEELKLPQMVAKNTESHSTAFTHSVDYKIGTSTGISASDRAATARAMTDPNVQPDDFSRPGHLFPLRAKDGGVLERPGHTETAVDLARLAGLYPAGILCELVNRDGSMSRAPTCQAFAREHGLQWLTIADLIAYRRVLAADGTCSPFQLALPSAESAVSGENSPASTPKSATYSAASGDLESSVSVSS